MEKRQKRALIDDVLQGSLSHRIPMYIVRKVRNKTYFTYVTI